MIFTKKFENGLRVIVNKMEGFMSVSCGILVKTGSSNENDKENGISHFIEHTMFKGTEKRTAFQISESIDNIGGQINAFTSKEVTCYYTKSTSDKIEDALEVLSDIFFNSKFDEEELEKEKGVVIEEIKMSEDTPEDILLDLLAESYYGKNGLGKTILGPEENIRNFTRQDLLDYMDKYYTADNVVISISGGVNEKEIFSLIENYFANKFTKSKSAEQLNLKADGVKNAFRQKKIEQAHIGISFPAFPASDERAERLNIANTILGGGMSSRLFQKVREELGLAYSVYSYPSLYKNSGVLEIYAGVNVASRDLAVEAILGVVKDFAENGITEEEFNRGKVQIKSSFVFGNESTATQMLLYGKYLLLRDKVFNVEEKMKLYDDITLSEVNAVIKEIFGNNDISVACVSPENSPIKI